LYQSKKGTFVQATAPLYGPKDVRYPGTPTALTLADDNNVFFVGIEEVIIVELHLLITQRIKLFVFFKSLRVPKLKRYMDLLLK
jgi:hypothetical protein